MALNPPRISGYLSFSIRSYLIIKYTIKNSDQIERHTRIRTGHKHWHVAIRRCYEERSTVLKSRGEMCNCRAVSSLGILLVNVDGTNYSCWLKPGDHLHDGNQAWLVPTGERILAQCLEGKTGNCWCDDNRRNEMKLPFVGFHWVPAHAKSQEYKDRRPPERTGS